jgi:hypothetical protein
MFLAYLFTPNNLTILYQFNKILLIFRQSFMHMQVAFSKYAVVSAYFILATKTKFGLSFQL